MNKNNPHREKILIVDDEPFNLDILEENLSDAGFDSVRAENGIDALNALNTHDAFDLIVIDRMMPQMDGIQLLKAIKANERHHSVPVIMQTADGQNQHMLEGIQAGAYYYLIKPFDETLLISIVKAALYEAKTKKEIRETLRKQRDVAGLLEQAQFRFHTLEEAKKIAAYVAHFCPDPENTILGLNELMTNAIEHGNLHLSYEDKAQMVQQDKWKQEVQEHLMLPQNIHKYSTLLFKNAGSEITITITDQGEGFNWKEYMDFDPIRMTEPFGRGIAMSKSIFFSDLEYRANGREAICHIALDSANHVFQG